MAEATHEMINYDGEAGKIQAYLSRPAASEPRPAVIVIHEIFGLNDQIKGVADRFAREGFVALAPHLYSRPELNGVLTSESITEVMAFQFSLPREKMGDPAYIHQEMAKLPDGKREIVQKTFTVMMDSGNKGKYGQDLVKAADFLNAQPFVTRGKIASLGFCFGGGMSIYLACHAPLSASVVFYGENPNPIDLVQNISGPVLGLYGGEDLRINSHLDELVKAMSSYKKDFEMKIYPGAAHAFFNETRPNYREAAASDAWERVLRLFQRTLMN
jgi:carboxymethylenebutenolidase